MNNNIIKTILASIALMMAFTHLTAKAESSIEVNTSANVPQQCQKLFKETDNLIEEASKQPGTHTQLQHIQSKLKQSKQKILEMELATQMNVCEKGLAKLSTINQD